MAEKTGSAVRGKNQKWQKRVKKIRKVSTNSITGSHPAFIHQPDDDLLQIDVRKIVIITLFLYK